MPCLFLTNCIENKVRIVIRKKAKVRDQQMAKMKNQKWVIKTVSNVYVYGHINMYKTKSILQSYMHKVIFFFIFEIAGA